MARILVVGVGDIGGDLAANLAKAGHQVWGLRCSDKTVAEGVTKIQADVADLESLRELPKDLDIVVYCVAAPTFTRESYHTYYYRGIRHILDALQGTPPKHAFFVSSSSVYHQMNGEWVDEQSPTLPTSFSGIEMLQAESALLNSGLPSTVVRFTGIYGPNRTRMVKQAQQGGYCDPEPPVWTNRIHRDDCIGVLEYLIHRALQGEPLANIYLATDDEPVALYDILEWMKGRIGEVAPNHTLPEATRRANRRCSNQRLRDLGYEFKYSTYKEGYEVLLDTLGLA